MRAGELDRRVKIEKPPAERGASGDVSGPWTTFATVWAGKSDRQGRQFLADRLEGAQQTTRWRIRWLAGVTRGMRVSDPDGIKWDIVEIAEIGRREGMDLMCVARSTDPDGALP